MQQDSEIADFLRDFMGGNRQAGDYAQLRIG
jgi:hypothetical protein